MRNIAQFPKNPILNADHVLIPISNEKYAIVDLEDADLAAKNWNAATLGRDLLYAKRTDCSRSTKKTVYLHRTVLERVLGRPLTSSECADHVDGNSLNDRRCNLRPVTRSENAANTRKQPQHSGKPLSSKYKGVSWHTATRSWRARIYANGKLLHLGLFASEIDAAKAYDKAARNFFNEFSRTNF